MMQAEGIVGNDRMYNRGFIARYLCHNDITVQTPVEPLRVSFYTDLKTNTIRKKRQQIRMFFHIFQLFHGLFYNTELKTKISKGSILNPHVRRQII